MFPSNSPNLILCSKKHVGWKRDLTHEGIEPNPGPSWDDFLREVQKKWPTDFQNILPPLQKLREDLLSKLQLRPVILLTKHVLEYLQNPDNQSIVYDLQLTDCLQDLIGILTTLEGNLI